MPTRTSKTGSELFIVDNSDSEWKVHKYLHDWCQLSKQIDIAVQCLPEHAAKIKQIKQQLTEFIGENCTVGKVGFTVAEVRDLAPTRGSATEDPTSRRSATEESIGTVWIDGGGTKSASTAGTSGFHGVPSEVWNFHIGGYQVCEKRLKDRKGRTLTDDDITHYHKIVVALSNTIRLMNEIDAVIETHGGWPGAFSGAVEHR